LPALGRTVLIIGTGPIGRTTARLLRAVGFEVRGAGRTARAEDPDFGTVIASASLADHVGWADHVVAVAPLTEQTRHLLDAAVFAAMKPTAQLINVGRGPLVDEAALLAALREGRLAAAALDVFRAEPLPEDHPLWSAPGVVVTPHLSGDVVGWREALARQFLDNAERWLAGRPLRNVVDKTRGYVVDGSPELITR
ncbi:MAG TPA: D-2-hydroxyacid dehydrogenase, partial [Microlunatus sp.]|nr:D-2-hydroxyacid dehydrogenase [Microlunatus sp.]